MWSLVIKESLQDDLFSSLPENTRFRRTGRVSELVNL